MNKETVVLRCWCLVCADAARIPIRIEYLQPEMWVRCPDCKTRHHVHISGIEARAYPTGRHQREGEAEKYDPWADRGHAEQEERRKCDMDDGSLRSDYGGEYVVYEDGSKERL